MKKLYIIQFRTDYTEAHEQECYNDELPELKGRIVYLNAVSDMLPLTPPDDMGAVIMGGSGQLLLSDLDPQTPWLVHCFAFVDAVLEADIPLMGVCFGGQLLAQHQGARMTTAEEMRETGTFPITLLDKAKKDPVFGHLPDQFDVQLGHKDTPVDLPDHFIPLAKSQRVACQAYRVGEKQSWGFIFHPELNAKRLADRLHMSDPSYVPDGQDIEDVIALFTDTPEAASILHSFVNMALELE